MKPREYSIVSSSLILSADSVRCFENFWSLGRCFDLFVDKHKRAISLVKKWRVISVWFTLIAKNFMLYCRLIYMLSMLYVRLTIKVKVGISESFKVGWYPHKITASSQLKVTKSFFCLLVAWVPQVTSFLRTQRMRITNSVTYVGVRVFEFL